MCIGRICFACYWLMQIYIISHAAPAQYQQQESSAYCDMIDNPLAGPGFEEWYNISGCGHVNLSSQHSSCTNYSQCLTRLHRFLRPTELDVHGHLARRIGTGQGARVARVCLSAVSEGYAYRQHIHLLDLFWHARAQIWRLFNCSPASPSMPIVEVDPYGRPPLPRRRPTTRAAEYRSPLPRRREVRLKPAAEAGPAQRKQPTPQDMKGNAAQTMGRRTRTQQDRLEEAVELLDKTKRQLRIPGSIGKAARKMGRKIQPTLKLSEAFKGEKAKPAKNKKGKGDTAAAATATRAASSREVVNVDGQQKGGKPLSVPETAVSQEITGKATSGQNKQAKEDDSYEYYTESTSESQSCVQMEPDKPCKRACADYMFAGCAILLIALRATEQWAQHEWTTFSILCLGQVFCRCGWPDTQHLRSALWTGTKRAVKGAYKLVVEQMATGAYNDELTYMHALLIILQILTREVQRWTALLHRCQQCRQLSQDMERMELWHTICQLCVDWLGSRIGHDQQWTQACLTQRAHRPKVHVNRGRGRKRPININSTQRSRGRPGRCGGKVRCMLYLACFTQMVNVAQSTGNSGQQIHNEADVSFLEVAAPVPNPEAETHVEDRIQAKGLGRGRSEGWESRQTPGNGVHADTRESTPPVKNGNAGRETDTPFSRIRKRAYKRALNRASKGPTMYRGQQVTLQDLQGQYVGRGDVQAQRRTTVKQQTQRTSAATLTVSCLTWNCGGLSNLRDEFFTWLDSQSYDVIFLQETWHTQSIEYTTRGRRCISSGIDCDPKRAHAGVMTMLRATVFRQDFIRRHEHVPLGQQIHEVDILQKRSQLWYRNGTDSARSQAGGGWRHELQS